MEITTENIERLRGFLNAGLRSGIGSKGNHVCVMAAIQKSFWPDADLSDRPSCVGYALREYGIAINDQSWSSDAARAAGMRDFAIAAIGSDSLDQVAFLKRMSELTVREIVPIALESAAEKLASKSPEHAEKLRHAAMRCKTEGSIEAARDARTAAHAAYAADDAAPAAAYASADAAAYASASAASVAYAASVVAGRDKTLSHSCSLAVRVLREMSSPGVAFL